MDTKKLCELLTQDEDIKDIPITYILRVAYSVLAIINEGECFYETTLD